MSDRLSELALLLALLAALALVGCGDNSAKVQPQDDTDTGSELGDGTSELPDTSCSCAAEEVCVNNGVVVNACFPADCPTEDCGDGEVCAGGECVSLACAGLYCGEYPHICRDGVCELGHCADPDVGCPGNLVCVNDECLEACSAPEDCLPLACLGGFCRVCHNSGECADGYLCVDGDCRASCQISPTQCGPNEYCDSATLACLPKCTSDSACDRNEICDFDSGECVPPECVQEGSSAECGPAEVCLNGRCSPANPPFFGNLCGGAISASSASYSGTFVLSPVEWVGAPMSTSANQLTSGAASMLVTKD